MPIYFVAAYFIWTFTTPVANKIFTFFGEKAVKLIDTHDFTRSISGQGQYIIIDYSPSPDGKPRVTSYRIYTFNTVFLTALILAVPRIKYKLKLKILLLGLVLIYPIQILRLVVYVFEYYSQRMTWSSGEPVYSTFYRDLFYYSKRALARLDGQLIPIVIWAGLYYYYKWHREIRKRLRGNTDAKAATAVSEQ